MANIEIKIPAGASEVTLQTAGKYCDKNIRVTSHFRMESDTITLNEDFIPTSAPADYKINCSSGAKLFVFYAEEKTYDAIVSAIPKRNYTAVVFGNAFEDNVKVHDPTTGKYKEKRSYAAVMTDLSYMGYEGHWQMMEVGTTVDNTDGISFMTSALKKGTYHWTAYYWDDKEG